jgi:hypothetical protein
VAIDEVEADGFGRHCQGPQGGRQVSLIGDEDSRADKIEPIGDGISGKQRRNRHGHQAGFPARDVSDGGPWILAEQQHDSVALGEAGGSEKVRQLIGFALYVAKRHLPSLAIGSFADQRNFARMHRVTVANIRGDVVARRDVPAE